MKSVSFLKLLGFGLQSFRVQWWMGCFLWGFFWSPPPHQGCLCDSDEHFNFAVRRYSSLFSLLSLLSYERKWKDKGIQILKQTLSPNWCFIFTKEMWNFSMFHDSCWIQHTGRSLPQNTCCFHWQNQVIPSNWLGGFSLNSCEKSILYQGELS